MNFIKNHNLEYVNFVKHVILEKIEFSKCDIFLCSWITFIDMTKEHS